MKGRPEAFSRVLIDQAPRDSGWILADPKQVRFEFHSLMAGQIMFWAVRVVLCVSWRRKKEDLDPYDAKKQAGGYAENLKAHFVVQNSEFSG